MEVPGSNYRAKEEKIKDRINNGDFKYYINGEEIDYTKFSIKTFAKSNGYEYYCVGFPRIIYDDIKDSIIEVKVENKNTDPTPLEITGLIWNDSPNNKGSDSNNEYDDGELYKKNVTVSLMDKNGIVKEDGKEIKVTTSNGEYNLTTKSIDTSLGAESVAKQLKEGGYYLEFKYDKEYMPVEPYFDKENGSKALSAVEDDETVKQGYAYIYNLSEYISEKYNSDNGGKAFKTGVFYNDEDKALEHMNLGIIKPENPEYDIREQIAYVKILINGYTFTYNYDDKEGIFEDDVDKLPKIPMVSMGDGLYAYRRAVYPSDIRYSIANNWDENSLKVYVVYRIDIRNPTTTNWDLDQNCDQPVYYAEINLQTTSLRNLYDKSKYELETEFDHEQNSDFEQWEDGRKRKLYGWKQIFNNGSCDIWRK